MSERITPERLAALRERMTDKRSLLEYLSGSFVPTLEAPQVLKLLDALEAAYTLLDTRPALPEGSGAALIAAERQRQIEVEGWTPEHDAGQREFYRRNDPVRNLVRAGAVIAAEIDRLRAAPGESPVPESGPDA